jgi:glutathione S-transferase
MSLALYGHPFSSYTQKALIALHENGTAFEFRSIDADHPQHAREWLARWPIAKFPMLLDGDRAVLESTIIIEYLQRVHPGAARLIPDDPLAALDVRFLDRFFDLHVMSPVQDAVSGALSGNADQRDHFRARARDLLERAYGWLEAQLAQKTWAAGNAFSLADCAAAPSLFYADWTHPIGDTFPRVRAYRSRLLERPSFARAVNEARPYRHLFPLGAPDRD